jgi:hypothetical protein
MLHMPDARVLGRFADGVILAVCSAQTMRDAAVAANQRLDFGCGGGFTLAALRCARRIGVEPNPHARYLGDGLCNENVCIDCASNRRRVHG